MRIGLGVALVFGVLAALAVWADVAQPSTPGGRTTVTSTYIVEQDSGDIAYTVNWRSSVTDRGFATEGLGFVTRTVAERNAFVRDCFEQAVVGESVPSACPQSDTVFADQAIPASGTGNFFLMSYVDGVGAEAGLDTTSACLPRDVPIVCP